MHEVVTLQRDVTGITWKYYRRDVTVAVASARVLELAHARFQGSLEQDSVAATSLRRGKALPNPTRPIASFGIQHFDWER